MMQRLRKFIRLSTTEQVLLFKAFCLLTLVVCGLRLFGFTRVRCMLYRFRLLGVGKELIPTQAAWAVQTMGRFIPNAKTCLPQSLVLWALLHHGGCPAKLRFGLFRLEHRGIQAHAWVENDQLVLLNTRTDRACYAVLPEF